MPTASIAPPATSAKGVPEHSRKLNLLDDLGILIKLIEKALALFLFLLGQGLSVAEALEMLWERKMGLSPFVGGM